MSTKHLNMFARDRRNAGSLSGLGKSRLETLEQVYLSQIKNKWYRPYKRACRGNPYGYAKLSVHRVQGVIFLTGRGFQDFAKCSASCSSVGKATLHRVTYTRHLPFHGYGAKND